MGSLGDRLFFLFESGFNQGIVALGSSRKFCQMFHIPHRELLSIHIPTFKFWGKQHFVVVS